MNSWKLRNTQSKLNILEKTEAHRKHLLQLVSAKTCLDTRNVLKPRLHKKKQMKKNNESMIQRIVKIGKSHSESQDLQTSRSLSRNLKTYSSLNRTMRIKQIDQQNEKLYSRLLMTSPTIRRQEWKKSNIESAKYKENLNRGKYRCLDYAVQAAKNIGQLPKVKLNKILNKTSERGKFYKIPL